MKKVYLIASVSLFIFGTVFARGGFPDVPENAWFYGYVNQIKDWGVISGNDDGTFAPERNINRAEFAKMLSLYDERVDQKIKNSAYSSVSTTASSPATVMYLTSYNQEPSACPSGWKQAAYATNWTDNGKSSLERTCYTEKSCSVMYLGNFNAEPASCPSGWSQSNHGPRWTDGGQQKLQRTCYVCS